MHEFGHCWLMMWRSKDRTGPSAAISVQNLLSARNEIHIYGLSPSIYFATLACVCSNYINFLTEVGPGIQILEPYV